MCHNDCWNSIKRGDSAGIVHDCIGCVTPGLAVVYHVKFNAPQYCISRYVYIDGMMHMHV